MSRYEFAKAWAIYTAHTLALKDGKDYRKSTEKRAIQLRGWLYKPEIETAVRFYTDRLNLLNISLVELDNMLENVRDKIKKEHRYYTNIPCCESCYTGSSATPVAEIESQRRFYGEYICVHCEELAFNMQDVKFSLFNGRMFLKNEGISSGKYLGFGGDVFLIKHKAKKWELTNNLFCQRSVHSVFLPIMWQYVNCDILRVESLTQLKAATTPEQFADLKQYVEELRKRGYLIRD